MPTNYAGDPANHPAQIQLPSDGDGPIKAADVNPGFEGLKDYVEWLRVNGVFENIAIDPGGALTLLGSSSLVVAATSLVDFLNNSELHCVDGMVQTGVFGISNGASMLVRSGGTFGVQSGGTWQVNNGGAASVLSGGSLSLSSGSLLNLLGRIRRAATTSLSDADHTLDVTQGTRFLLSAAPAAIRTETLDKTTGTPIAGEIIELVVRDAMATGKQYIIKNGSGGTICEFWGNAAGNAGVFAEFEFVGSDWRLGRFSGGGIDGSTMQVKGAA